MNHAIRRASVHARYLGCRNEERVLHINTSFLELVMTLLGCRSLCHWLPVVSTLVVLAPVWLTPIAAQSAPPRPAVKVVRLPVSDGPTWPVDLNGDGKTDLVGSTDVDGFGPIDYRIVVQLGKGDGTFQPPQQFPINAAPMGVGDFNNDSNIDVVVSGVAILPGNGDGTFGEPRPVTGPPSVQFEQLFGPGAGASLGASRHVLVADFNKDGNRDLGLLADASVDVYPGNGDFTFGPKMSLASAAAPQHQGIARDVNNDGLQDIVSAYSGGLDVFINRGGLLFDAASVTLPGNNWSLTGADLNRDGSVDLIVTTTDPDNDRWEPGRIVVLLGTGTGTFKPPAQYTSDARGAITVVTGDFNGDGLLDVATGNLSRFDRSDEPCAPVFAYWDSVTIFPGKGDGTFAAPASFDLDSTNFDSEYQNSHHALRTSDFNGDRRTDLITSAGAIVFNIPAAANRPPLIEVGEDRQIDDSDGRVQLSAEISDPDHDHLEVVWTDSNGRQFWTFPAGCPAEVDPGTTLTATVTDGRGGSASDSLTAFRNPFSNGWIQQDVGAVGARGDATFDGTTFTVRGSGADIWGTADEFHAAFTLVSGDVEISGRVATVQNVNAWTKAGFMIRETLDPGSRHASIFATPGTTKPVSFQRRPTTNGTSVHTAGPIDAPPLWLRLRRAGNVISAFYKATEAASWTLIGTQTIAGLPQPMQVGIVVSSHVDGTLATATFDHVEVTTPGTSALPAGFAHRDIGATGAAGAARYDAGTRTFTIDGAGADIWNNADAFHYVYTPFSGDGTISVRVTSVQNVNAWTKAGVMFREALTPGSKHVMAIVSPGKGVAMQYRATTSGTSASTTPRAGTAPQWLRLKRAGNTFTAHTSEDGSTWTLVGSTTVTMVPDIFVGLPVTSHVAGNLATARFDNLAITRP